MKLVFFERGQQCANKGREEELSTDGNNAGLKYIKNSFADAL